jgi:hypothetical protein
VTLLILPERVHVTALLALAFAILSVALIIGSVWPQWSRPQGMRKAPTPRTLRRIARIAEVPELGTMIVVYRCLITAVGIPTLNLVALYQTPKGRPPPDQPDTTGNRRGCTGPR